MRSTIAAEALSLQEKLEAGVYYRHWIEKILGVTPKTIPVTAYTDNRIVIEAVYSTKMVDDKRLRVDIAAIREFLETNNIIEIQWCSGGHTVSKLHDKARCLGIPVFRMFQSGKLNKEFFYNEAITFIDTDN